MKTIPNKLRNGKWSQDEHERFLKALDSYGRSWAIIAKHVGTRSAIQIRSHAQKFFLQREKVRMKERQPKASFTRTLKDVATQYGEDVYFSSQALWLKLTE
mmetsp:Transcript_21486/g.39318  ORF Transcript_21486/g.39318 Transcript_21486/m.39318 type:complete len:101 (+) Transcript_21486:643-945(+)